MTQHFVTFCSPGIFVAETTIEPIESWNVDMAVSMASKIVERHGARPYGFRFSTRERRSEELDSKTTETSPMYYLNGTIETIEQIEQRGDPNESILLSNMRCNNWKKVVRTASPWSWVQPLNDEDVVLRVRLDTPAQKDVQ